MSKQYQIQLSKCQKTLTSHIDKNKIDICVVSLSLYIFTIWKCIVYYHCGSSSQIYHQHRRKKRNLIPLTPIILVIINIYPNREECTISHNYVLRKQISLSKCRDVNPPQISTYSWLIKCSRTSWTEVYIPNAKR